MQKSFRNTLILLGVMAVLFAWYFIYEQKIKVEKTASEEKTKQLITLTKEEIQELEIEKKELKMHFKKTGEKWAFTAPLSEEADSTQIDSMLASLVSAHEDLIVDEAPKDLARYGLKEPSLIIRLWKNSQETPQAVSLGEETPAGNGAYALLSRGQKVYRIPSSIRPGFDKKVEELRNKNIFEITRFEVTEVDIKTRTNQLLLKKGEKDSWVLPKENLPADSSEVSKLLNAILDAKATAFGDDKLSLSGEPDARITLVKPNQPLNFILKWVGDKLYLKREDKKTAYQVDIQLFEQIQQKPDTYFNKDIASFNRFDSKKFKIEKGKDVLELVKGDGPSWSIVSAPTASVDTVKVDQFLSALQDSKFEKTLKSKGKGISIPDLTIRVFEQKEGKEIEKVVLKLKKTKEAVEGERQDLPVTFKVKEEDFKKLNLTKADFLKAEPTPTPAPQEKTAKPNLPLKEEKKS